MRSRKNSKNLRQTLALTSNDVDSDNSDNIDNVTTILPSAQPVTIEPSSFLLYEPQAGRVMRSRRNTFTYGQVGEGNSSQFPSIHGGAAYGGIDSHNELVPYSKEWTVILYVFIKSYIISCK